MDGRLKTSTPDAITRGPLYPCLRSKTATALAVTPKLSGSPVTLVTSLLTVKLCFLTYLAAVTSLQNMEKLYSALSREDPASVAMDITIWEHLKRHSMGRESVTRRERNLGITSHSIIMMSTCSLTWRMKSSQ